MLSQLPASSIPTLKTRESELKGHTAAIDQLAWKASEPVFATVSGDKSCRIWDARSSELCITTPKLRVWLPSPSPALQH